MRFEPLTADIADAVHNVIGLHELLQRAEFNDVDATSAQQIIESGAAFVREKIAPVAAALDSEGCRLVDGRVRLPDSFVPIWRGYADDGWLGLSVAQDSGGGGFPQLIQAAFSEMVCGVCVPASMIPLVVRGAAEIIRQHGSEDLKQRYLADLISGRWAATICITEAGAGSDVGAIETKADQGADGVWRLTGTKIFISFGDHQLSEGILHMALARPAGAPKGSRGLRLFAVPAYNDRRRDASVQVARIEQKLGLHVSPTCELRLDKALGIPIGETGGGLNCIFTMINLMRLEVAVQGVGLASAATQAAERYAGERLQGARDGKPATIAQHPDVRRNLLTMRTLTKAARVLGYRTAACLDLSRHGRDAREREHAEQLAGILLPIVKAGVSETAVEVTSLAIQVFGGHGYVRDSGVERLYRDARILPIYEGTTGIQAIDLVTRKLATDGFNRFLQSVRDELAAGSKAPGELTAAVTSALQTCESCASHLREIMRTHRDRALAGATPFIELAYRLALGWAWLRICERSQGEAGGIRTEAIFFAQQILPVVELLSTRIRTDCSSWLGRSHIANRALTAAE